MSPLFPTIGRSIFYRKLLAAGDAACGDIFHTSGRRSGIITALTFNNLHRLCSEDLADLHLAKRETN